MKTMQNEDGHAEQSEGRRSFIQGLKFLLVLGTIAFIFGGGATRTWMLSYLPGSYVKPEPQQAPLRLLRHVCHFEAGYQICEGEVRNDSDERIENLMAEVTFRNKQGTFVKSDNALVDYQPVMPGQTTPFKVITTNNPQISSARVRFKTMFGGEVESSR